MVRGLPGTEGDDSEAPVLAVADRVQAERRMVIGAELFGLVEFAKQYAARGQDAAHPQRPPR